MQKRRIMKIERKGKVLLIGKQCFTLGYKLILQGKLHYNNVHEKIGKKRSG